VRRPGSLRFVPVSTPDPAELQGLVQRIAERIGRSLERSGLITRDIENAYLAFDPGEEAPINSLLGASITYRIATGPREGQKVFTLQTIPAEPETPRREVAESSGFSLHAGIAAKASQRDKLEHLARYVSRPPVATERLLLTEAGLVRLALKTPYRDGTTHVIFEAEDFIGCRGGGGVRRAIGRRPATVSDLGATPQAGFCLLRRRQSRAPPQGDLLI
jgi:hypothetical protein